MLNHFNKLNDDARPVPRARGVSVNGTDLQTDDEDNATATILPSPKTAIAAIEARPRTIKSHGISAPEVRRWNGALFCHHRRSKDCRKGARLYFGVAGDALMGESVEQARKCLDKVRHDIVTLQNRQGLEPLWQLALEVQPALHGNFIFLGTAKMAAQLREWNPTLFIGPKAIQPVYDQAVGNYCIKEATPEAVWGKGIRRVPGSHHLPGGGDRIRLSRELEALALAEGLIDPWHKTYAKRTPEDLDRRKGNSGRKPKALSSPAPFLRLVETAPVEL